MRRGSPEERPIPPDMRYNSVQLQTMVQHIMKRGKKSVATHLIYDAMDLIKERTQKDPLEVFDTALKNVGPAMEVRPLASRWRDLSSSNGSRVRPPYYAGNSLDFERGN